MQGLEEFQNDPQPRSKDDSEVENIPPSPNLVIVEVIFTEARPLDDDLEGEYYGKRIVHYSNEVREDRRLAHVGSGHQAGIENDPTGNCTNTS